MESDQFTPKRILQVRQRVSTIVTVEELKEDGTSTEERDVEFDVTYQPIPTQ